MKILRTPDECFDALPGFPFAPRYLEIPSGDQAEDGGAATIRVHYLDEGPPGGDPVLLMHGEPSWSFLYRHMIARLVPSGFRCVAPDLVGFGRSDKPASRADHTYARHVEWMSNALFEILDLRRITLVCQDWGGLIGLRLVAADPERFARVVVANTGLPHGGGMSEAFLAWQRFAAGSEQFPVGRIVGGGCATRLAPEVVAAYDAPFPDESYKEGARIFPSLVPTSADDPEIPANKRAWEVLASFERPFLTAFSDGDPITKGGDRRFRDTVPGAHGQPHTTIAGGGHFLQEDRGEELAKVVADFIGRTPAP